MSGQLHIQDLSNMSEHLSNMSEISLTVSSPASTSNCESLLTTPTLGVGSTLENKHELTLPVRLNLDTSIGKFNKQSNEVYADIR